MVFFKHNFRWQGTILMAFNVLATILEMVWGPILGEILAINGVIHL